MKITLKELIEKREAAVQQVKMYEALANSAAGQIKLLDEIIAAEQQQTAENNGG